MNSQYVKNLKLPDRPGVYFFIKGNPSSHKATTRQGSILYIGKATSLKDRVKSYFSKDPEGKSTSYGAGLINTRGPLIVQMVKEANKLKWQETDSVLEALILEANLIKKYQPKYNTKEKDNKSFNYVCITKEAIPKVLIVRGRNLEIPPLQPSPLLRGRAKGGGLYSSVFGPFPNGSQLKEAMKIIRRIFPYIDNDSSKKNNKEFYRQLGLIPKNFERSFLEEERSDGKGKSLQNSPEYKNNIKNLKLFFEGKKKSVFLNLKKEMIEYAKKKEFEKANEVKKKIFALEHINDVALIKEDISHNNILGDKNFRIEAYDIAHMSGKNMVGVMTVVEDREINKKEYRKFLIKTQTGANDTGALAEILSRRFKHNEWRLPDMVVIDGSTAQINVAKKIIEKLPRKNITQKNTFKKVLGRGGREPVPDHFQKYFSVPYIVAVVKDDKHKANAIMGDKDVISKYKKEILLANSEAHRFAITFHKTRRDKNFIK